MHKNIIVNEFKLKLIPCIFYIEKGEGGNFFNQDMKKGMSFLFIFIRFYFLPFFFLFKFF